MTTIAWDGRTLAADSRATSGDTIMSDGRLKIGKRGRVLVAAAGTGSMCREFRAWVLSGLVGDPPQNPHPQDKDWSYWGIVITPAGGWVFQESGVVMLDADYYAMGSGRDFALGAMAMGATATEAVRAAMKHDSASGGTITELRL